MSSSCIFVSCPTSRGLSTLSTTADHERAEQGEGDALPDLARGDEHDRRRYPDQRTTHARDDRQHGHHRSPEDRPIEAYRPERQASKDALRRADQDRALEGCAGN
jgi:hypothetical protein